MFKRILTLMRQDWTNSLRDNILLYMIFGPTLLAVGARFLLPSLDQAQFTFAAQSSVENTLIQRLERIGQVQTFPDARAVRERVMRSDDVPGLILQDGSLLLVLEGNESEDPAVLRGIVEQALSGEPVASFTRTQVDAPRSLLGEYTTIIFIMIGMLLGALVMAFNIVEDKETQAVRAMGVSPLSMLELTLARGFFALILSLFIVIAATLVLVGTRINYSLLFVGFLFSAGLPILTGYVVGGLADSQLKAIAILKFYMLVYLTLPIVTIFLPRTWHVFFYFLPNYWMWQTFEKLLVGELGGPGFWLSGAITLSSSLVLVAFSLPVLRRQLKLR
jgi:ABC-2 type transport system permease protein